MRESREEQQADIVDTFRNHIIMDHQMIYREGSPMVEVMTWGDKSGSSCCRIDYMVRNGALCVYGDLGEAVYRWYGIVHLKRIADFNLGYFHGKSCASISGARGMDWDEDQAMNMMKEAVKNTDCEYYRESRNPGAKDELRRFLDTGGDKGKLESLYHDDPALAFGGDQDWWEWFPTCGDVIPRSTHYHLIGLKMAFGKI